jgi:dynein heavy chain
MNIVMFEEAIAYLVKIYRIIKMGKGHALLIGEGGSGRHSLTNLASFMAGYKRFQIKISKGYGTN